MALHKALVWYLRGEQVRRDMRHSESIPTRSFQQQWMAGPNATVAVDMLRRALTNLTEDIELWLRQQIEDELKREHGVRWWSVIPGPIQQRAGFRYKLACADYGKKRAGPAHSGNWFSFGDIIKLLDALTATSWQRCLDATGLKRRAVSDTLRAIKAFRDNRIAHPHSGGVTRSEIIRFLQDVESLVALMRPADYLLVKEHLKVLKELGPDQRSVLFDIYESRRPRLSREVRLRTLKQVLSSSASLTGDANRYVVEYIDELLCCCREASATISPWVGDA
jgi:hypothetical protein